MEYTVVFEKGDTSYGAFVPDLPGCVAVGNTPAEVERLIREAIALHIEGMREAGEEIPQPHSWAEKIDVESLGEDVERRRLRALAKAMDESRKTSGPIGIPTWQLVHEGRRFTS